MTAELLGGPGYTFSYEMSPFPVSWVSHSTDSAWPHSNYLSPLNIHWAWPIGLSDAALQLSILQYKTYIIHAAQQEGQTLSGLYTYPNYAAAFDNSLEDIYGPNVPELKALAAKYDPAKVMTRTGGFLFQK